MPSVADLGGISGAPKKKSDELEIYRMSKTSTDSKGLSFHQQQTKQNIINTKRENERRDSTRAAAGEEGREEVSKKNDGGAVGYLSN